MTPPIPYEFIQQWKQEVRSLDDPFINQIPKLELHVHLEGTLTPSLRWRLGERNRVSIRSQRLQKTFTSEEELQEAYNLLQPRSVKGVGVSAFFDAYYGGMEVLLVAEDFYDLAMNYFRKASEIQVRYCEVFFDPQAHTRRGVAIETVMAGLRRAKIEAERNLNVKSQWIMCILRELSPKDAMETYVAALPFRDLIVGIGLDGNEFGRPPSLFEELYCRAREDGFKLTCHCDVAQKDTHEHIRQVISSIGKTGADRLDHGLDAAERPELVAALIEKKTGVTLCPWAYVRHHTEKDLFSHLRTLLDAGVKVTISSDSPAYVEDNWLTQNLSLLRLKCGFTNEEIVKSQRNAIEICWAGQETKDAISKELRDFESGRQDL